MQSVLSLWSQKYMYVYPAKNLISVLYFGWIASYGILYFLKQKPHSNKSLVLNEGQGALP